MLLICKQLIDTVVKFCHVLAQQWQRKFPYSPQRKYDLCEHRCLTHKKPHPAFHTEMYNIKCTTRRFGILIPKENLDTLLLD